MFALLSFVAVLATLDPSVAVIAAAAIGAGPATAGVIVGTSTRHTVQRMELRLDSVDTRLGAVERGVTSPVELVTAVKPVTPTPDSEVEP